METELQEALKTLEQLSAQFDEHDMEAHYIFEAARVKLRTHLSAVQYAAWVAKVNRRGLKTRCARLKSRRLAGRCS